MTAFIRPCIRSGQIACRKLSWVMLYATAPKPPIAADAARSTTAVSGVANGRSTMAPENTIDIVRIVGPTPSRPEMRLVVTAATSAPMFPIENAMPSHAADISSSRTA